MDISFSIYNNFYLTFIPKKNGRGNTTPTYNELIIHLEKISNIHSEVELYNMGPSDYGLPIYLCIINGEKDSANTFKKAREETTILFNNAIHPGEPDAIYFLIWLEEIKIIKKTLKIFLLLLLYRLIMLVECLIGLVIVESIKTDLMNMDSEEMHKI